MDAIQLFDVQAGLGGARPGQRQPVTAAELGCWLDRLEISRAVVRLAPDDLDCDVPRSNELLFAAAREDTRFAPCPTILPAAAGDVPREDVQVAMFVAGGAAAVCIRPAKDGWSLSPWCSGRLFTALAERRVPTLCLERYVTLEDVARLAERHPGLPFVVAGVGYRSLRTLLPLLQTCENVYLSAGSNFAVYRGIELLASRVGPQRLLFGTGFPEAMPAMAVSQLMYAELSDNDKALIGGGNLTRLMMRIAR